METIQSIITFIVVNKEALILGASTVLGGLAIIAKITKSPKDDRIVAKILSFLNLIPVSSEEKPEDKEVAKNEKK